MGAGLPSGTVASHPPARQRRRSVSMYRRTSVSEASSATPPRVYTAVNSSSNVIRPLAVHNLPAASCTITGSHGCPSRRRTFGFGALLGDKR